MAGEEEGKENIPEIKKPKEEEASLMMSPSRRPLKEKGSINLAYYVEPEGGRGSGRGSGRSLCVGNKLYTMIGSALL